MAQNIDFKDDGLALITLLHCLDKTVKDAEKWFQKNLQVNSQLLDKKKVSKLIGGEKLIDNRFLMECRRDYRVKMGLALTGNRMDKLQVELDGIYWN